MLSFDTLLTCRKVSARPDTNLEIEEKVKRGEIRYVSSDMI